MVYIFANRKSIVAIVKKLSLLTRNYKHYINVNFHLRLLVGEFHKKIKGAESIGKSKN